LFNHGADRTVGAFAVLGALWQAKNGAQLAANLNPKHATVQQNDGWR
jgi:hypothetical protein